MSGAQQALVLGCGSIGTRHMRNLVALGVTVAGYDPDPARRRAAAEEIGVAVYGDLQAALERTAEMVVVAAPTRLHLELAETAAAHNLALFIEKPLAHSWQGVPGLLASVAERRLTTLVGCNLRFHPTLRRLHALLREGAIGRPLSARIEFGYHLPDWHPHEDYRRGYSARRDLGGGVTLDAIHELDYARWMLGDVRQVACLAERVSELEIDTEDVAAILLDCGAVIAEVHLDYLQRAYSRTCQLVGSDGTLRWDYGSGELRLYRADCGSWTSETLPPGWEANDMYLEEMRHFLGCVRERAEPEVDVAEGAEVLRVALAALRSARERRFVAPGEIG